ncbi:MAG: OmpH family outer membrane protein [Flavobacteriales bacterium]|nr:OmpH family outer membrane protein [Flavobacteriales bacterium]
MKSLFKVVVIAVLILPFTGNLMAQKVGHVDVNKVMADMPEIKKAEQEVAAFTKELEGELQNKNASLQTKYQEFQAQEALMSDLIKQSRIQEIQELEKQIQNFQMVAEQNLQQKIQELQIPIRDKVTAAIAVVAKDKGYAYILDIGAGVVPYYAGGNDVTELVKAKL